MSVQLPNGTIVSIASAYGTSKTMSAISNAAAAVATLEASHGVAVNDIFEMTSGWERANGRIFRASVVATNDVTVEGLVTTSTSLYPAGTGTGSVREISTWQQLSQILESTSEGGEQQYRPYQFLSDTKEKRKPTIKSAQGLRLLIADDPSLSFYSTLRTADQDQLARAFRFLLPNGGLIYLNATVAFNEVPRMTVNELMAVQLTLSFEGDITRYTS